MRPVPLLVCLALGSGIGGCVSKTDVANAPSYSMLVRRSSVDPVAPGQPSAAEGGNFREDLRFAGDYRERIAFAFVHEYLRDGIGPAEISAPVMLRGLLGDANQVVIRFPVRTRTTQLDRALGLVGDDQPLIRCIGVSRASGLHTLGERKFITARQKDDRSCAPTLTFAPFGELERMAEKTRQCKARGKKDCVLYTNLPETEAARYAGNGPNRTGTAPK